MLHSIKRELMFLFVVLSLGTVIILWIINSLFLEKYYTKQKCDELRNVFHLIEDASGMDQLSDDEFDIELQKLCAKSNISVIIIDEEASTVKSETPNEKSMADQLLFNIFMGNGMDNPDHRDRVGEIIERNEDYTIQIMSDTRTRSENLEMWGILSNANLFLLISPLEGIQNSVRISNRFLLFIAIFVVFFSCAIGILMSRKIAKPIQELTTISQRMRNLDFGAKYQGTSRNEIGVLGENINKLSESLEKNISELKSANLELRNDLDEKTKAEEMRREFLSNVSHELKTPIALIQGYAEGLQEGIIDDPEQLRFYCDVIVDEASKMNEIVSKLLTLNSLEFGSDPIAIERFDLAQLVKERIKSSMVLFEQNQILCNYIGEDSVFAWGDAFKIEEVFLNYLSNAIHYADGEKRIDISIIGSDSKIRLEVFNTGKQIPEDSLSRVWDKFYKVDKARTREYGGSGVGLSIVKAIMDSMGGGYGVDNREDGVVFWIELEKA